MSKDKEKGVKVLFRPQGKELKQIQELLTGQAQLRASIRSIMTFIMNREELNMETTAFDMASMSFVERPKK